MVLQGPLRAIWSVLQDRLRNGGWRRLRGIQGRRERRWRRYAGVQRSHGLARECRRERMEDRSAPEKNAARRAPRGVVHQAYWPTFMFD